MRKLWSDLAWEQLQDWSARDRKTLKRIYALVQSIDRNGYSCIGKPEPLKGNLAGWWSVRIDEANRLVFRIDDGILVICSCMGHYTAVDPA
jgi:toxin YoeB